MDKPSTPPLRPEIRAYYEAAAERERLAGGPAQLEYTRTQELVRSRLPPPPAVVLDVGGGPGAYAVWLASLGYAVHLIDPVLHHVEQARVRSEAAAQPVARCTLGDARALAYPDASAGAVLMLGPLYHLIDAGDRRQALEEARRVLVRGGVLFAAAISRFASILDGLSRGLLSDPAFAAMAERDLASGVHRNETGRLDYFTTAQFHRPEELAGEVAAAGFEGVEVFGVEGPGWLYADFDARWRDPGRRAELLQVARALEREASVQAVSAHLLAVAQAPGRQGGA